MSSAWLSVSCLCIDEQRPIDTIGLRVRHDFEGKSVVLGGVTQWNLVAAKIVFFPNGGPPPTDTLVKFQADNVESRPKHQFVERWQTQGSEDVEEERVSSRTSTPRIRRANI